MHKRGYNAAIKPKYKFHLDASYPSRNSKMLSNKLSINLTGVYLCLLEHQASERKKKLHTPTDLMNDHKTRQFPKRNIIVVTAQHSPLLPYYCGY